MSNDIQKDVVDLKVDVERATLAFVRGGRPGDAEGTAVRVQYLATLFTERALEALAALHLDPDTAKGVFVQAVDDHYETVGKALAHRGRRVAP